MGRLRSPLFSGGTMRKLIRERIKTVEDLGFEVVEWRITGGCHLRFLVRDPKSGKTQPVFMSQTPSDHRIPKKIRAQLKRMFVNGQ